MLLPSGNDAAYTLAEYFSNVVYEAKYSKMAPRVVDKIRSFSYARHPICFFLAEMNGYAKELGMKDSYFDSPHGLANRFNMSTVADMAKLTHVCMKNPLFKKVVGTHRLETRARGTTNNNVRTRYRWTSTNKLLGTRLDTETNKQEPKFAGVKGCKTGITPSAGPCMSSYFERVLHTGHPTLEAANEKREHIIVVTLHSRSMEARWVEIPELVNWFCEVKRLAITQVENEAKAGPVFLRPTSSSQRKHTAVEMKHSIAADAN